jgi:hypothetical protein
MFPAQPLLSAQELARLFSERLAEHLPGTDTGDPEITDKRTSWNKSCLAALNSMARSLEVRPSISEVSEFSPERQVNGLWYRNDAPVLVIGSAWSDRAELDRSFWRLLMLKAPQKLMIYSCKKSQAAVLDQFAHALAAFPYHLASEEYVAVNIMGAEQHSIGTSVRIPRDGAIPFSASGFEPLAGSPYPLLRPARVH